MPRIACQYSIKPKKKKSAPKKMAKKARNQSGGDADTSLQHNSAYDYKVSGGPAFAEVVVKLKPGQAIVGDGGALQYWKGPITPGELKMSFFASIGRALSNESLFLTEYNVPEDATTHGTIAFASSWPGDAFCIELKPGETWKLSRGAFLASSPNITVSGKLNWRGIFEVGQDEGFILPKVTCDPKSTTNGFVFVAGYGGVEKHEIDGGDTLMINNGLFMAAPEDIDYKIEKLGKSYVSSLFGGEGLGMAFTGPCTVYTQSRNLNDLVAEIGNRLPQNGNSGGVTINVGGNDGNYDKNNVNAASTEAVNGGDANVDLLQEGGGNKRKTKVSQKTKTTK